MVLNITSKIVHRPEDFPLGHKALEECGHQPRPFEISANAVNNLRPPRRDLFELHVTDV